MDHYTTRPGFLLDHYYLVTLQTELLDAINLTLKSTSNKVTRGFYIPQTICKENHLLGTLATITISLLLGFPGKITEDERVRIPNQIVIENKIK